VQEVTFTQYSLLYVFVGATTRFGVHAYGQCLGSGAAVPVLPNMLLSWWCWSKHLQELQSVLLVQHPLLQPGCACPQQLW